MTEECDEEQQIPEILVSKVGGAESSKQESQATLKMEEKPLSLFAGIKRTIDLTARPTTSQTQETRNTSKQNYATMPLQGNIRPRSKVEMIRGRTK